MPRRARGPPRRRADPASRARGPRGAPRARRVDDRVPAEETPVYDPAASPTTSSRRSRSKRGTSPAASRAADLVVEGEYRTGHQEQLYIEPNGVIAVPENGGDHRLRLAPVPVLRPQGARRRSSALPPEKVRVVQTETGGGFGGKEEYPSMIAGHAALLALKARRPVKIVYDRVEDMLATTKRHPVGRPAPHRGPPRRTARRDGHRRPHGRRRLRRRSPPSCSRAACSTRRAPTAATHVRIARARRR